MTFLDRLIQRLRIRIALRYLRPNSSVLDVGCHQGELFEALGEKLGSGVGIDPLLEREVRHERYMLVKGYFPGDRDWSQSFDHICFLAVLEHIPMEQQLEIASRCYQLLQPGGTVIITVPSPRADVVLDILKKIRLIKGMSLEDHYGFQPDQIPVVYGQMGFTLEMHKRFQAGFNNIFVLRKGSKNLINQ